MNHKIIELFEQSLEVIAVGLEFAASYIEVVNHALEKIAHILGRAHGVIVASIFFFKGLSGIHRVIFKGKTKSLVSKIAKTVMFTCISGLSLAAIVAFAMIGAAPSAGLLVTAISIDMALAGFRHLRTRKKVARLKALSKALTSDEGMTQDEKSELVTLMKDVDITEESLGKMEGVDREKLMLSMAKRHQYLEGKMKKRLGKFVHSCISTGLMVGFTVMVFLNPVAALVVVGVMTLAAVVKVFKVAHEVHKESIIKKLKSDRIIDEDSLTRAPEAVPAPSLGDGDEDSLISAPDAGSASSLGESKEDRDEYSLSSAPKVKSIKRSTLTLSKIDSLSAHAEVEDLLASNPKATKVDQSHEQKIVRNEEKRSKDEYRLKHKLTPVKADEDDDERTEKP